MFSSKLRSIESIHQLNISPDSFELNKRGSVVVRVGMPDGKVVNVSRNQLIDKIEKLVKKALEESDPDALKQFLSIKKFLLDSDQTTQVKGTNAKIRRFFGNLFRTSRKKRLEKLHGQLIPKLLTFPDLPPMAGALRKHLIKRLKEEGVETTLSNFEEMFNAINKLNDKTLLAQFLQFYKSSGLEKMLLEQAAACLMQAGIPVHITTENFSDVLQEVQKKDFKPEYLQFFTQSLGILVHLEIIHGK